MDLIVFFLVKIGAENGPNATGQRAERERERERERESERSSTRGTQRAAARTPSVPFRIWA
jgi:hypothetical protein